MFKGQSVPVTNETAPNVVDSGDGFHLSYNASSADYGSDTTAIVINQKIFLILNGDHKAALNNAKDENGLQGCFDYFVDNLDKANKIGDHKHVVDGSNTLQCETIARASFGDEAVERLREAWLMQEAGFQSNPALWHGTSSKYIDQILRDGLLPQTSCYDHVCLSSDKDISVLFGSEMALSEKHDFVLLKIDVSKLDVNSFVHEKGWLGNSIEPDVARNYAARPWVDMLKDFKVIGYEGTIPASALEVETRICLGDLRSHKKEKPDALASDADEGPSL